MTNIYVLLDYFYIIAFIISCIWLIITWIKCSCVSEEDLYLASMIAFGYPLLVFFAFVAVILGPYGFWHFLQTII